MLGIGIGEMIIIAGIALMVIGPEKFPDFAKIAIRTIRDLRGYVEDIQTEVTKELAPVKKELEKLNKIKPEEYIDSLIEEKPHKVAGQSELDHNSGADPTDRQHDGSGGVKSAPDEDAADQEDSVAAEATEAQAQATPETEADTDLPFADTENDTSPDAPVYEPVKEETTQAETAAEETPAPEKIEYPSYNPDNDFDNLSPPERLD